jgi:hypothetical protein
VQTARIFSQAQLRAYITVTRLEIERGDPNHNVGGTLEAKFWMARPSIENSGSTPTRNLRWIMGAAAQVRLIVWCKACQHQVEPDPAEMAARYGSETPVLHWCDRLVYSKCGSRQVDMVVTGERR